MVERPIPILESTIPKEPITDEELGNLLAAYGNHEAKAVTLLAMRGGSSPLFYTSSQLNTRLNEVQGDNPGWNMETHIPFSYCDNSLAPIGLVVKDIVDLTKGIVAYSLTEYGETIGKPLAALLLDFSERHPGISLLELFGQTSSPSKGIITNKESGLVIKDRPPITRIKIFQELLTAELPIRAIDLKVLLGTQNNGSWSTHLSELGKLETITYDFASAANGKSTTFYQLSPDRPNQAPTPSGSEIALTATVYEILEAQPTILFDNESICRVLLKSSPQLDDNGTLKRRVWNILSHLANQRYSIKSKLHEGNLSEITLTSQQRGLLQEIVDIVDGFRNRDPKVWAYAHSLISEYNQHPARLAALMKKARKNSKHALPAGTFELSDAIFNLIKSAPGITNAQLRLELKKIGIKKSTARIVNVSKILEKSGLISSEKQGSEKHFFSVEDQREA